jgi:hypothetical protein
LDGEKYFWRFWVAIDIRRMSFSLSGLEKLGEWARGGGLDFDPENGLDNCELFLKTSRPMRAGGRATHGGRSGGLGFKLQAF